jgi:hypothetical protein
LHEHAPARTNGAGKRHEKNRRGSQRLSYLVMQAPFPNCTYSSHTGTGISSGADALVRLLAFRRKLISFGSISGTRAFRGPDGTPQEKLRKNQPQAGEAGGTACPLENADLLWWRAVPPA